MSDAGDSGPGVVAMDASAGLDANPSSDASTDGPVAAGDANVDDGGPCADVPPRECVGTAAFCGELVRFEPAEAEGYVDYPVIDETASNQYRSYARRDVVALVQYAAARVACVTRDDAPTFHPLGLGDMSEADGSIPGTSGGDPGHPAGTHTAGTDVDVSYYQLGTADNQIRPVCPVRSGGVDVYHCSAAPTSLDVRRTTLFFAALAESDQLRVIGVDGQIGTLVLGDLDALCAAGTVPAAACTRLRERLAFETTDGGLGWFYFHYARATVSFRRP